MSTNYRNEVYLRDYPEELKYRLLGLSDAPDKTECMLDIIKELSTHVPKPEGEPVETSK